jgi:23S rRNA (cytosine1962-C5)-methyltransferase
MVSLRGARRVHAGHPWIFRSDVAERPTVAAGIVQVRTVRGEWLGWALWSPLSEISLRIIERNDAQEPDAAWWHRKLERAMRRRDSIGPKTTGFRLVHGEGDGLPSLVVDRYGDILVAQILSAGVDVFTSDIVDALVSLTGCRGILARNDPAARAREGLPREVRPLFGDVPRVVEFLEDGLRFLAAPWDGQKTGAFVDQRDNRMLIGSMARGEALDCFAYHGSFALHMARNATRVTALDVSAPALARVAEHARMNGFSNVDAYESDAFDALRNWQRDGRRFDTIVVDPPAFAKTKGALEGAIRGYKDINLQAMKLLAPGGVLLTASCSFHLSRALFLEMLQDAASDSGRSLILRSIMAQPVDHPELLTVPETGYLKAALVEARD